MFLYRPQRAWERQQIAWSIGEPYQKRWYSPSRSNRTTYDATAESNVNNKMCMLADCSIINCDRIWEKGPLNFCAKCDFLPFFKLSPFQGLKSPRLLAWFVSSLDLLLHRSVRSLSKPPVPSGEPPKWGIERRFSNAMDVRACPAHTGRGRARDWQRV